jgi:hypothetical protein
VFLLFLKVLFDDMIYNSLAWEVHNDNAKKAFVFEHLLVCKHCHMIREGDSVVADTAAKINAQSPSGPMLRD